ncbi:MAG: SulP family inorganic anion transporter [Gammaproteobacteria bacterium]
MNLKYIKGDLYGGITAAVVAIPLALAFGVSSGAGAMAGLYGAIFVGLFAALFGGTPTQISGPTGPMTVVMAGIFTQFSAADINSGPIIAFTVVILGGVIQVILGILRVGKYIKLIPIPVISGFMSGIGMIIILLQLGPLLGHEAQSSPQDVIFNISDIILNVWIDPAILGGISLCIVYLMPSSWNRIIPSPLVALIGGTFIYFIFYRESSIPIIGHIPTELPAIQFPVISFELFNQMVLAAFTLAFLGSIDSLLTSLVADNLTRTHHNSNKELIGQGIGNIFSGLIGGLPGAGATMRTVVNIKAGGVTKLSGVIHSLVLLAIVLGASGFAEKIPHAVLAAILIKVGTDIIDWGYLKNIHVAPKPGVFIMIAVFLITVFIDLIAAVAVGMVIASFVLMQRMANLQIEAMHVTTDNDEFVKLNSEEKNIFSKTNGKVALYQFSGPLSFPAAKDLVKLKSEIDEYDVLILDFTNVNSIDYTSCQAIKDIIDMESEEGRRVLIAGASKYIFNILSRQKILVTFNEQDIYENRHLALEMGYKLSN